MCGGGRRCCVHTFIMNVQKVRKLRNFLYIKLKIKKMYRSIEGRRYNGVHTLKKKRKEFIFVVRFIILIFVSSYFLFIFFAVSLYLSLSPSLPPSLPPSLSPSLPLSLSPVSAVFSLRPPSPSFPPLHSSLVITACHSATVLRHHSLSKISFDASILVKRRR